ncbi:hypothetical protein K1719_036356 [Acacia pycnantha]|nr:hypothetical protein K1719_036356 [Acacia pycnantha]
MDLENQPLSQQGCKYQVFLSYTRDKDTPKSFALDLYSSLRKDGISILKDEISQSNIEGFEISIIIFTNHYASSRRCLEELTKIMKFRKSRDHALLPIFYGVDKYDVRNQEFSFGETFQYLIQRISPSEDEVSRWRTVLSEAGGIYGFDVPDHIESR